MDSRSQWAHLVREKWSLLRAFKPQLRRSLLGMPYFSKKLSFLQSLFPQWTNKRIWREKHGGGEWVQIHLPWFPRGFLEGSDSYLHMDKVVWGHEMLIIYSGFAKTRGRSNMSEVSRKFWDSGLNPAPQFFSLLSYPLIWNSPVADPSLDLPPRCSLSTPCVALPWLPFG